jgi:hypothetical protein
VAAGLIGLGAVALALVPWVIDLATVRADLERQVSRMIGGQAAVEALDVRLLPFPRGIARGVRIEIPGVVGGRVDEIDIHLRLWALLAGRVEVRGLTIVRPVLRVTVPEPVRGGAVPPADPLTTYRRIMQPIAEAMRRSAPALSLTIRNAQVEVVAPGLPPFGQVGIDAQARSDARGMEIAASATGRLWQDLKASARVEYEDLAARLEIQGSGFKPQTLLDHFQSGADVTVGLQLGEAHVRAQTDGRAAISATLSADVPKLTVVRDNARPELAALRAEAGFNAEGSGMEFTLQVLRPGGRVPLAAARLRRADAQAAAEAAIEVPALELAWLRDVAQALAADRAWVARYAARVRGGTVTGLRVDAQAPAVAELIDPATIEVRGTLQGGAMLVPYIEREAADVSAVLAWSRGVLTAASVSGRIGGTRVTDGSVEFRSQDRRLAVALGYDVDLQQGLETVRRLLAAAPRDRLGLVRSAAGRAQGRLTFTQTGGRWQADLAITGSDSVLRLRDVPWPVQVRAASMRVSPGRLAVADAAGAVGASAFRQAGVELTAGTPWRFDAARGVTTLALAQLYPWLRERPAVAARVRRLKAATGEVDVVINRAAGRIDQLGTSLYDLTLRPRQLRAELSDLPAPVLVDGGAIGVTPHALRLDGVMLTLLDARARVSGAVRDYRTTGLQADLALAGAETGDAFVAWVWERAGEPARLRPKTPLRITAERVRWSREAGLDLRAAAQVAGGPSVEVDATWTGAALDVRRAHIKDAESDATLSLTTRGRLLDTGFSGVLTGRSVAGLFAVDAGERTGRVEGDMRATLDRDLRGRTTARGRLIGEAIRLDRLLGVPLAVERIDLDADGTRLRVSEASIEWAQQKATVRGEVRHGESGPLIDAQVDTPGIVVDALLPTRRDPEPGAASAQTLPEAFDVWPLPAAGKLAMRAGFLQYRKLRMEGVEAVAILEPERARLNVTRGTVCEVAFPLVLELTPQGATAAVRPWAQRQRIETVAACLTEGNTRLTGELDLRADLRASGRPGEYLRSLEGPVELHGRQGRVMKWGLLGNILALKSVSTLLEKGGPRLDEAGFDYREIVLRGRFAGGRLLVEEGTFDSAALGLAAKGSIGLEDRVTDLDVLVAPFSRVDRIVRRVPIVGYIVGGAFTSVPVSVQGNIFDPVVVPLGPKAVVGELAGVLERTLKLPARLVQPAQPAAAPSDADHRNSAR